MPYFHVFQIVVRYATEVNDIVGEIREVSLQTKKGKQPKLFPFFLYQAIAYFLTVSATAVNAAGWFIAKSAKTLRFMVLPA